MSSDEDFQIFHELDGSDSALSYDSRYVYDDMLTVLQANPLVVQEEQKNNSNEKIQDFKLNFWKPISSESYASRPHQDQEKELQYVMASSRLRIRLEFCIATRSLLCQLLLQPRQNTSNNNQPLAIHLQCPSLNNDCICLEHDTPTGEANIMTKLELTQMLQESSNRVKFMFSNSLVVSQACMAADVPHIVYCSHPLEGHQGKRSGNVGGQTQPHNFANCLYTLLAEGKTIQEAFQSAKEITGLGIVDEGSQDEGCNAPTVQLLPTNGNHNVPLFTQGAKIILHPNHPHSTNLPTIGPPLDHIEHKQQKKDLCLPRPSTKVFVGRQVIMHEILSQLRHVGTETPSTLRVKPCRLLSVVGSPGTGKTTLVQAACQYLWDRIQTTGQSKERMELFWLPLLDGEENGNTATTKTNKNEDCTTDSLSRMGTHILDGILNANSENTKVENKLQSIAREAIKMPTSLLRGISSNLSTRQIMTATALEDLPSPDETDNENNNDDNDDNDFSQQDFKSLQRNADNQIRQKLERELQRKKHSVLIIIDFREAETYEASDSLLQYLDHLLRVCLNTTVIVIGEPHGPSSLQLPSRHFVGGHAYKEIEVKPLGFTSAVTLFGLMCPFVQRGTHSEIGSVQDLKKCLVPSEGYQGSDRVKRTIVQIHNLLGAGLPSNIIEKATSIDKEGYESLIQLAKLRQRLSDVKCNESVKEFVFRTRFELDFVIKTISESIETLRRNRNIYGLEHYEVIYREFEQRRDDLPSVESMLITRKALQLEIDLAKAADDLLGIDEMVGEIQSLEQKIDTERRVGGDDEAAENALLALYPHGITWTSLEARIAKLTQEKEKAKSQHHFVKLREVESNLRELQAKRYNLYPIDALRESVEDIESQFGKDRAKKLYSYIRQEEGVSDLSTICNDFVVPAYVGLRWKKDADALKLVPSGRFSSRIVLDRCLSKVRTEIEIAEHHIDIARQNKLVEMYNSLLELRGTFPSLEALLIQRKGLEVEMRLVCSTDEEIMMPFEKQIEELESHILQERQELGEAPTYAGVWIDFYTFGITRSLLDRRIDLLSQELDFARTQKRQMDAIDLKSRIDELESVRPKLPTGEDYHSMISEEKTNLAQLEKRQDSVSMIKWGIVSRLIDYLEGLKRVEDNCGEKRSSQVIADELFVPDLDFMSFGHASLGEHDGSFINSFNGSSSFQPPSLSLLDGPNNASNSKNESQPQEKGKMQEKAFEAFLDLNSEQTEGDEEATPEKGEQGPNSSPDQKDLLLENGDKDIKEDVKEMPAHQKPIPILAGHNDNTKSASDGTANTDITGSFSDSSQSEEGNEGVLTNMSTSASSITADNFLFDV